MKPDLKELCAARIPAEQLGTLAGLRCHDALTVRLQKEVAWLRWTPPDEEVVLVVLSIPQAVLYRRRDRHWFEWHAHVPTFDTPFEAEFEPLQRVLFPDRFTILPTPNVPIERALLQLVPSDAYHTTRGMRCSVGQFAAWAESVPSRQLAHMQGARCQGEVFVAGVNLPPIAGSRRYWGVKVMLPLGKRIDLPVQEAALRSAHGVEAGDLLVIEEEGAYVVPESVLQPLSRAALKLALTESSGAIGSASS